MPFKFFLDDSTDLQYRCYNFHTPHKVDGERFFTQISFENCSVSSEIKLPHMLRKVSNAPSGPTLNSKKTFYPEMGSELNNIHSYLMLFSIIC